LDSPTQQQNDAWRELWVKLQQDLANLSSKSELIVAEKSDHIMMLFDQVDLCVAAIKKQIKMARNAARTPSETLQ